VRRPAGGAAAAALLLLVPAAGAGAAPLSLDASLGATGWIDLEVTGRPGTTVTVTEEEGEHVTDVALSGERAERRRAAAWRCDRPLRRFVATAPADGGGTETATAQVRTPGCEERLAVRLRPFVPRAGGRVLVRVRDHWALGGLTARVCLAGRCRGAEIPRGRATVNVRLRARGRGMRRLTALAPWGQRLERVVEIRRGPLRLLATGDSMIQIVDSQLQRRLRPRGVRVSSDARISTGISKPAMLDWVALARRQARARRPNVTVMLIGANDGFAIGDVDCCDEEWRRRYAARVRRMVASYRRGGAARVYWLTLPAPRSASFARVFRAINAALRLAEPALHGSGRIIDLGRVFTPRGRFRASIGGRVVRQADGVHLNVRGAAIAAGLVIRQMRRDGVLD
jgi:lysophospholipase L1-like esterase